MPMLAPSLALVALAIATTLSAAELPPADATASVIVAPGIADDFDPVRKAVSEIKERTGRDYRVVVVDSEGREGGAGRLLPRLVDRWWESRTEGSGYDPAGDVTILLDIGDRSIAMDVPPSLLAEAGLDLDDLERRVITDVFVPKAKDMRYADGLAELVTATQQTITDRIAARAKRARDAEVFRTRTLPIGLVSLAAAGVVGWLAWLRIRHASRRAAARERLAAFKQEVVSLSDLLDAQRERHRMLPHSDPDFKTPMTGMTRNAYDAVQDAIARYRERWLGLMDVWERAEKRMGDEWFLGTAASDDVVAMLDAADARPPLDEVATACRAPLDALETSHERARELAATLDGELAAARARLDALAARGRSAAAFEPTLAEVHRGRELGGDDVESDPVAARGRLEEAQTTLQKLVADVEAVEAADDRRRLAAERVAEIRRQVAARRSEGWLLREPGADPDDLLTTADREATRAGEALDAADMELAAIHLERSESAAAEAAKLVESVVAARSRAEALLATLTSRLESITAAGPAADGDLAFLADRYAETAWEDLAGNPKQAAEAARRAGALVDEGRAEADLARQYYFRAVAALEEAERQADWALTCLAAVSARRRELDELVESLPALQQRVAGRVAELAATLGRQRTDRARANERCREAGRILEAAGGLAAARRPDPRLVEQAIRAADMAAARGEEFAAEDARLAAQAVADLADAEGLFRRAASWYAEGVKADVRGVEQALRDARSLLEQQRYEDAIHAAGEAGERARLAYAAATAEAERRRARRIAEQRQRQLEESFARMSRGVGPWVISLPSGGFTGPNPWRSNGSLPRSFGGGRSAGGGWSRDVAEVRW
ncbi:MAG: hypothetical protein ACKOCX_08880 [Planctomycetota bacterium]